MTCCQSFQQQLTTLPPLSQCQRLPVSIFPSLYTLLYELGRTYVEELQTLTDTVSEYMSRGEDLITSQLDNLSDRSAYLYKIEESFKTEWSDSNIENSPVLINVVSSVWITSRRLVEIRHELHTVIMLHCPPAYNLSPTEIDLIWNNSYPSLDTEVAEYCSCKSKLLSSLSKDSLLEFSDKWVDILLEKLQDEPLASNPTFDPILFIAMKLHSLAGRLAMKCRDFHTLFSPRVIPLLNSILMKCPVILKNFTIIEELVKKRPICAFVQDCITTYKHDNITIDALRKQAKQFQIQYVSLSDYVERYLSIFRYSKLKDHYDEVFLIHSDDDFNLIEFEDVMSEIQEMWDARLENILSKYIQQLEFIFISDNFQNELTKAREFLSQYECTLYQKYEIMNKHNKDINNFIFSSHWIDSRQQEKSKLLQLIRKFGEESMSDDEDTSSDYFDDYEESIINRKTGSQLLRIIDNDFKDFLDLYETVRDYYEEGIELWREFLCEVRNFDENLPKKSYLLTTGFVKFEDPSKFAESVRNIRFESADLENFADAHVKLQYSGNELCKLSDGSCQEFIQGKLGQFYDQIDKMRLQAFRAYRELNPWVGVILGFHEDIKKVEDILVETQKKIEESVDKYSQAKPDVFMSYLRSSMCSLKERTELSTCRHQLDPLLKFEPLDLSLLLRRYEEAELKLDKILSFLLEKLEQVFLFTLEETRKRIESVESYLFFHGLFFQSLSSDSFDDTSKVTTLLSKFKNLFSENFFNDDYFNEIQLSIHNLIETSRHLVEEDVKAKLLKEENFFSEQKISFRSNKILMHFAITYHELNEVLKLRESFLSASHKPSYMADKLGFVANQIDELFGQDFRICHTYCRQLRNRYDEYLCDENQPPILPLSLETVSRLESRMRERLEKLEHSLDTFNRTFQEVKTCVTQFRSDSVNILAFAEKIETAFSNKESSPIRDSSALDTQVTTWELLLIEGQSCLSAFDISFELASKIYDTLLLSPKVLLVKNLFPKANEHLEELKTCLAFFQKYQADLTVNEVRLSAMTNSISHFYMEMRFPSISTNGNTSGKNDQKCRDFQLEIQSISNSVRALRNSLPELQAGTHQFVEYSIIEEDRLKLLEDKLPEWENKISGLSQECNQMSAGYTGQLSSESGYNGHLSFDIISQTSDHDSGSYAIPDHYLPSHQESRLQLDVKESMTNLQGVIDENAVQDHTQANLLSPTAPVCVEFLFEPEMNQTLPPLLTEEEVLRVNLPPGEGHDADHPLTKCFAIITETLDFFQHFSSTGPHIEDSSQNLIKDVQRRYTECHTDVISILNATADLTNPLKDRVQEWLDTTQTVRDTLKARIETRRCEWEELVEKYNTANGYINALESDLESYKNEEWPNDAEFENAVESSANYLQERIECYNEFSPRMFQLTVCDTCEDGSCQGWRDELKIFRNKLTTIKAEFNNLLHSEPIDSVDSFIVINPVESTLPTPSHTVETVPLIEPDNPPIERTPSPHFTHFSRSTPPRSFLGETTLSWLYFLVHFLFVLFVIFSIISYRYIRSVNSNLKGHLPQLFDQCLANQTPSITSF